jgi:hypothetical protein
LIMLSILLSFALLQAGPPIANAPAQAGPGTGTSEIRGRITEKETGRPLVDAIVSLTPAEDQSNRRQTRPDDQGGFQFTKIPAGSYFLMASPGEFRATHLMESFRPTPLTLKEGEVRSDANLALPRAHALTVRVLDEWGEPLTGMTVQLASITGGLGFRGSMQRHTDDRGLQRVFPLERGRYVVCAEPGHTVWSAGSSDGERFARTCYGADGSPEPVVVGTGDSGIVEIRMRRSRTFSISGVVLDASGKPASGAVVSLNRFERNRSSGISGAVTTDGRFTMRNILPGDYAITASPGGPVKPGSRFRPPAERAYLPVRVDATDIEGLVVSMVKGVDVAGRIVLEDSSIPFKSEPGWAPPLIQARLADDPLPGYGATVGDVMGADRAFLLEGMFGARTLELLNVPRPWYVKAIRYHDKDITDVPVEFKASSDPSGLEIVLSTRGAVVSGRVLDDRGNPVSDGRVVMFSADPATWLRRYVRSVSISKAGAFQTAPHRRGDYFIVALDASTPPPDYGDRDGFARLAKIAERISLGDEEQLTLDLPLTTTKHH